MSVSSPFPRPCLSASFVDNQPEPFRGIARECIPLHTKPTNSLLPAAERADLLEIQLRSHLLKLVQESLVDRDALENVGTFWRQSLELCLHLVYFCDQGVDERYKGMSVRKLPWILLEDTLDALPLVSFQRIWETIVEPALSSILFAEPMWPRATLSASIKSQHNPCALPFIKLCNKFLRKLDVHKNDWPGRILLTLAKAFPLSDKSATKIWGSFHTENVTEFESQEEFDTQQKEQQTSNNHHDSIIHHPKHNRQLQTYSFYETFWSVQQDFSNPTGIKVADFLERMRTILAALESHPLIRSHMISLDGNNKAYENHSTQVKYLTSSHLLPIQLGDPEFRVQFLTQFLIVENHLSSESPALGNMLNGLHKRARDLLGRIQPHGHKHLQFLEFLLQHREKYWRQWKKAKCQPDLETPFVTTTDGEVDEEGDNEKKRRRSLLDRPLGAPAASSYKKPKDEESQLIDFILHEKKDLKATCALPQASRHTPTDGNNNNTRDKVVPSLEEHLEAYVDALDPDAGIEAEYHPKNDSLFTWRALRLLSRDHLGKFHMINHKGDFEKMVRHIYAEEKGVQIPGEAPAHDEHPMTIEMAQAKEDEEEQQQQANEDGNNEAEGMKKEETRDEEMQDARDEQTDKIQSGSSVGEAEGDVKKELTEGEEAKEQETESENQAANEKTAKGEEASLDETERGGESPMPMDEEAPLEDDDEKDDDDDDGDDDSDEPTRVKDEIESEDEGEIEESRTGKSSEHGSPSSAPLEGDKELVKERPPSRTETPVIKDEPRRGANKPSDRRDEDCGEGGGGRHQQRRGGDFHGSKGRPQHRGGGGRGGVGGHRDRNDGLRDRGDGPPGYNREHGREHQSGPGRQHRGGRGGGDGHQRSDGGDRRGGGGGGGGGGNRDYGPSGASGSRRGGPDMPGSGGARRDDRRGTDERWDDRRGGGGGAGRRDDRRGGGGDRRGDRRGGRGDGRRHRR